MSSLFSDFLVFISSPVPVFVFGLCWGSFLNVVAHRLLCDTSPIMGRSRCPRCAMPLNWYDLIPVLSWLWLRGRCRTCKTTISWLYPFIELLTAITVTGMVAYLPPRYLPTMFLYLSALIVTVRTDITDLVIMRQTTLFILPLAPLAAHYSLIQLTLGQSIIGALVGAGFLAMVSLIFWFLTGKIGLGQGDIELCALIGGWTGIIGWWVSLLVASVLGTALGLAFMAITHRSHEPLKIPFGALLALGSLFFIIFRVTISSLLYIS